MDIHKLCCQRQIFKEKTNKVLLVSTENCPILILQKLADQVRLVSTENCPILILQKLADTDTLVVHLQLEY